MPIYEFYCGDCHRIFSFLSRRLDPAGRPRCPRCGADSLGRRPSAFAISRGRPEPSPEGGLPDLDEARLEQAMTDLAREAEGIDENDPRQAARLMRRIYAATGLPLGPGVEEAMRRLEAGEDPEAVEAEMGDVLEQDPLGGAPTGGGGLRGLRNRLLPPSVDPDLYEM